MLVALAWEAAAINHKSWYMHIMLYILPRFIFKLGDLWAYATGALEQRGAQLKRIGRCVVSFRPFVAAATRRSSFGKTKVTHAHKSSAVLQIAEVAEARVRLREDPASDRFESRENTRLLVGIGEKRVDAGRRTKHKRAEGASGMSKLENLGAKGANSSADLKRSNSF